MAIVQTSLVVNCGAELPDRLTAAIGIEPDEAFERGGRRADLDLPRFHMWCLERGKQRTLDLGAEVEALVNRVKSPAALTRFVRESGGTVRVRMTVQLEEGDLTEYGSDMPNFWMSPGLIRKLADLDAELAVEIVAPDDESRVT